MDDSHTVNDDTSLGINLKWLIQIVIVAGMIVWGYFSLTSRIAQLEIDVVAYERRRNNELRISS